MEQSLRSQKAAGAATSDVRETSPENLAADGGKVGQTTAKKFKKGYIKPNLRQQLRGILQQYPDDGQILKELIQNADDAGATKICFMLDKSSYGTESLENPKLKSYQGPALYAYNNATFTDQDWEGIRLLLDSIKAEDKLKVGRFGLGFKSVFHLTDMPGIVSGGKDQQGNASGGGIAFLEPFEEHFEDEDKDGILQKTSSMMWSYDEIQYLYETQLHDQFDPFLIPFFNCTIDTITNRHFSGTLFRFPLRTSENRRPDSKLLSNVTYDFQKVMDMLDSLTKEPEMNLLFLRNIQEIEIYVRDSVSEDPKSIFRIKISDADATNVTTNKKEFMGKITNIVGQSLASIQQSFMTEYSLSIHITKGADVKVVSDWLVVHRFGFGPTDDLSVDLEGIQHLPWMSAAVQRNQKVSDKPNGHVFCFLPLPLQEKSISGFHAHINGYFAVAPNRRHLKWATADQDQNAIDDKDIIWNQLLLTNMAGQVLLDLMMFCIKLDIDPEIVYSIAPNPDTVEPEWSSVVTGFYKGLMSMPAFLTTLKQIKTWLDVGSVVWGTHLLATEGHEVLSNLFMNANIPVVLPPNYIKQALLNYCSFEVASVSPCLMVRILKEKSYLLSDLSMQNRNILLAYILSVDDLTELIGLEDILPLADGNICGIRKSGSPKSIYMAPEEVVLLCPQIKHLFLDTNQMESNVLDKLTNLAQKGITQIKSYSVRHFATLFKQNFHDITPIHKTIPISNEFSIEWLERVWDCILNTFPNSLTKFEGSYLILVDKEIVKLDNSIPIILTYDLAYDLSLPTALVDFLKKSNIFCIKDLPSKHKHMLDYINLPTPEGVIRCIQMADLNLCQAKLKECSVEDLAIIRKYFSDYADKLTQAALTTLSNLPLFHLMNQPAIYCIAEEMQHMSPFHEVPYKLFKDILARTDIHTELLGQKLGLSAIKECDFYRSFIIPYIHEHKYSRQDITQIMDEILGCFDMICHEDESFPTLLKDIAFIKTQGGVFAEPINVFDCHNEPTLGILFSGIKHLLQENLFNDSSLAKLKLIGLKGSKNVTMDDIIEIAQYIDHQAKGSSDATIDELLLRSQEMISFLYANRKTLKTKKFQWKVISGLTWLPVATSVPEGYPQGLNWSGRNVVLSRPDQMFKQKQIPISGSVGLFHNLQHEHEMIFEKILTFKDVTLDDVFKHFKNLTELCQSADAPQSIAGMVQAIYQYLSANLSKAGEAFNNAGIELPIWTGNRFIAISQAYIGKAPTRLEPYLHEIPGELSGYSKLFTTIGVQECTDIDYVSILAQMTDCHSSKQSEERQQADLSMAIAILNFMAGRKTYRSKGDNRFFEIDNDKLFVPVKSEESGTMKMVISTKACYGDHDMDCPTVTADDGKELFVLHELVPPATAKALNIPHWGYHLLSPEELGFESYGQGLPPLTTRLHDLLEDYSDGFSVLKEIIQNADDAGAKEVCFLYDERDNACHCKTLFDAGMTDLQGPALFAYNDSTFDAKDFENIVKVGGATKKEDSEKVGRFGLGFNAVYNLTDVPCFYSNGKSNGFVVFDPHCYHLGNAIRDQSKPGIKINFQINKQKIHSFHDQLYPFKNIFGCTFDDSFTGTIFRFPLRTDEQANKSLICSQSYGKERVTKLFQLLKDNIDTLFLFLQSVCKISVHHLKAGGDAKTDIQEIFSAKLISNDHIAEEREFLKQAKTFMNSHSELGTLSHRCTILTILSECALNQDMISLSETPKGKNTWLVCETVGMSESLAIAKADSNRSLLPVGGAAVMLESESSPIPIPLTDSRLFCFLPLPSTGVNPFPLHLNGYFNITSDRRNLYMQDKADLLDPKAVWNNALMNDAVCEACFHLLHFLTNYNLTELTVQTYYKLWPIARTDALPGLFKVLCDSFMSKICSEQVEKLFWSCNGWQNITDCLFPDFDVINSAVGPDIKECATALSSDGFHLVFLPSETLVHLKRHLRSSGQENKVINLKDVYVRLILPNLTCIPIPTRDKLICHALKSMPKTLDYLKDCHCIPVSPNGVQLKKPSVLINPEGPLSVLFEQEEGLFPHFSLEANVHSNKVLLSVLLKLGMHNDNLTWDTLVERSIKVSNFETGAKKQECSKAVISVLFKKVKSIPKNQPLPDELVQFCSVQTVPVMPKPDGYPVPWAADEHKRAFCCLTEALLPSDRYLVGSQALIFDDKDVNSAKWESLLAHMNIPFKPKFDQVFKQLTKAISFFKTDLEHSILSHFKIIFDAMYFWLNRMIKDKQLCDEDIARLKGIPLILIDDRLYKVEDCARYGDHCIPYYQIMTHLQASKFSNLWQALGLKDYFAVTDLVKYLTELKNSNSELECMVKVSKALGRRMELDKVIAIDVQKATGTIYLPAEDGKMYPASELCYNNCPWLPHQSHKLFCHKDIPPMMAERLGVQTIRAAIVGDYSIPLGTFLGGGNLDTFGRSIDLAADIRATLNKYPVGFDTLFELVRNSDHAGATDVHFVLDKRSHRTEKLFSESWEKLQGPSLLVYNNRPLREADLINIQKSGLGKRQCREFPTGIENGGFTGVYHFTDTPMILTDVDSKELTLCVFDPLCRNIQGAYLGNPGQKYVGIDKLRESFPDVFETFCPDMFQQTNSTIFRFPLRTALQAEAEPPIISTDQVSVHDVARLLKEFKERANDLLLFLHHVKFITITVIGKYDAMKSESFNIKATMSPKDEETRKSFHRKLRDMSQGYQKYTSQTLGDYKLSISDGIKSSTYRVVRCLGLSRSPGHSSPIFNAIQQEKIEPSPIVEVAISDRFHQSGTISCMLPLEDRLDIPVIINGHFSLLNGKSLLPLTEGPGDKVRAAWNKILFEDPVKAAFVHLLMLVRQSTTCTNIQRYCNIFPNPELYIEYPYIEKMALSLYNTLAGENVECFPVENPETTNGIEWFPVRSENFHRQCYFRDDLEPQLCEIICDLGLPVIHADFKTSQHCFKAFGAIPSVTPSIVRQFMHCRNEKSSRCKLTVPSLFSKSVLKDCKRVKALLRYCMSEKPTPVLEGIPLLVTASLQLKTFSRENFVYFSEFSGLFPDQNDLFLHDNFKEFENNTCVNGVIREMHCNDLNMFLERLLTKDFLDKEAVPIDKLGAVPGYKRDTWLLSLWDFLAHRVRRDLGDEYRKANAMLCLKSLKSIADWNLLPVTVKGKTILIKISDAENAIIDKRGATFMCSSLLSSISFMQVALSDFGSNVNSFLQKIVGSIDNPRTVLKSLEKSIANGEILWGRNQRLIQDTILYVSQNLKSIKEKDRELLKKLPLFKKKIGDYTSIEGFHCYMVSADIPLEDLDIFRSKSDIIFLVTPEDASMRDFYKLSGIKEMDSVKFYSEFCLIDVHFQQFMTKYGREVHLKYLRDKLSLALSLTSPILKQLKDLAFIQDGDDDFYYVSDFFDNDIDIFRVMGEKSLPKPYCNPEWKDFMKKCGLIHTVPKEKILCYANTIACACKSVDQSQHEMRQKAFILIKCLFDQYYNGLVEDDLLKELSKICFVPAHLAHQDLHLVAPQHGTDIYSSADPLKYIAFNESCVPELETYVWTSANVLPFKAMPEPPSQHTRDLHRRIGLRYYGQVSISSGLDESTKSLLKKLGVYQKKKVPPEYVVKNLENICVANISHKISDGSSKVLERVVPQIYEMLEKHFSSLTEELLKRLRNIPCVGVKDWKKLVHAKCICEELRTEEQIEPYLYKLPNQVGQHAGFVRKIGGYLSPCVEQYCLVLETIKTAAGQDPLTKDELSAVEKVIAGIYSQAKDNPKAFNNILSLPLPFIDPASDSEANIKLGPGNQLIYNDSKSQRERKRLHSINKSFLLDFKSKSFGCDCDEFLKLLPKNLKPEYVSEVVTEVLVPNDQGMPCPFFKQLKEKLHSSVFLSALRRIAIEKHGNNLTINDQIDECHRQMKEMKIQSVFGLRTVYRAHGNTISESSHSVPFYLDTTSIQGTTVLWLNATEFNFTIHGDRFVKTLARHFPLLSRCNSSLIRDLFEKPLSDIIGALDYKEIGLTVSCPDIVKIGAFLPIEYHHLIDYHFQEFSPGEFAVMQVEETFNMYTSAFIYVRIGKVNHTSKNPKMNNVYEIHLDEDDTTHLISGERLFSLNQVSIQGEEMIIPPRLGSVGIRDINKLKKEIDSTVEFALSLKPHDSIRTDAIIARLVLLWSVRFTGEESELQKQVSVYLTEVLNKVDVSGISVEKSASVESIGQHGSVVDTTNGNVLTDKCDKIQRQRDSFLATVRDEIESEGSSQTLDRLPMILLQGCSQRPLPGVRTPNPQPGMAQIHLNMARCDLDVIQKLTDGVSNSHMYDWLSRAACKCVFHSMTALLYFRDADDVNKKDDLDVLKCKLGSDLRDELQTWIVELLTLVSTGDHPSASLGIISGACNTRNASRLKDLVIKILDSCHQAIK